jgi:hypothetical protein
MSKSTIKPTVMGKAYEYACILALKDILKDIRPIEIIENDSLRIANDRYNEVDEYIQKDMLKSSLAGIRVIIQMEPKIIEDGKDKLTISLQPDNVAMIGDVRDVLLIRHSIKWEIGISVKHNHEALKHSRLSSKLDFGKIWFGVDCSEVYFNEIYPIFNQLKKLKNSGKLWAEISNKTENIYEPLLNAFKKEFDSLYAKHQKIITEKLILYLLGSNGKDYYKMIHWKNKKTKIQSFNLNGTLNQESSIKKPDIKLGKISLPTKIIGFSFKENSKTTLELTMNNGWAITFRIHNAKSKVETSLKFDIQLLGHPSGFYNNYVEW